MAAIADGGSGDDVAFHPTVRERNVIRAGPVPVPGSPDAGPGSSLRRMRTRAAMIVLLVSAALAAAAFAGPGPADVRQDVDYRIEAILDEATHVLTGRARLRYGSRTGATLDTLYLHLYLNAFRPNSAWARRELQFGERRFQDLGPADHAFERLLRVEVDGVAVEPAYPGAPDSTVVALPLPKALGPGERVTVLMDWQARLSTVPRRQGRAGRDYDFAHWYPRIAVYDEERRWEFRAHLPQGEFNGEFGTYDVTLDVRADQVIGATGVPVEGDPGWERAAAQPGREIVYRREAYGDVGEAEALGLLTGAPAEGRKRVRWYARDVHHFAWSTSPDYIYEGGEWNGTAIHVLYRPGDRDWSDGVVVERTARALAWFDTIFGPYPYPQVTNVHRIEPGGTEFPMLVMNGSPSQGLIIHEVGHIYAHGILANNEWREGWLDEGLVTFLANWYAESRGDARVWPQTMEQGIAVERSGRTLPIGTPSADFPDFFQYQAMTYIKPALVFRMLLGHLGDEPFRRGLRVYYERNRFTRVTERELRAAFEEAAREDLDWFFDQWIHTTGTLDYGIGAVETAPRAEGGWRTRVEVVRSGENWMPVELEVDGVRRRLDGRDRRQWVEVDTPERPRRVILDPDGFLLDVNPSNNRRVIAADQ